MSLDKPYLDVPGTTIFDADQSRKGYWLNQFCMSLMKADNRARFKADERAYLDAWPMSEEQKQAVLARDLNWMMRTGGNIYFLAKIGATDGKSFQQMAGSMTGMSEQQYRDMMIGGGRRPVTRRARRRARRPGPPGSAATRPNRPTRCGRRMPRPRMPATPASRPRSTPRTCRPSAPRSTTARPASPTGNRCSPATTSPSAGWPSTGPTSSCSSTTTTRPASTWA
jgi:protocatechuate 4,5-dioxygenase, alpha chain